VENDPLSIECPEPIWPEVFMALYNNSKPVERGFLHYEPGDMTFDEAVRLFETKRIDGRFWFDYWKGRPIKVSFGNDRLYRPDLYDRDNGGPGTVAKFIAQALRRHAEALKSREDVRE